MEFLTRYGIPAVDLSGRGLLRISRSVGSNLDELEGRGCSTIGSSIGVFIAEAVVL